MATPTTRIEKEVFLNAIFQEQVPVMYLRDRSEHVLTLANPAGKELFLKPQQPVNHLAIGGKLDLMFEHRGKVVSFAIVIKSFKGGCIVADTPEFLYQNLDRSYSRITAPPDLEVHFVYLGDRYNLAFPRVTEYEKEEIGEFVKNMDTRNLSGLIEQMAAWIQGCADGYKFVIFKNVKPASTDERIIAETGKALYLPSTQAALPESDTHPKKRLITADMFRQYLKGAGMDPARADEAASRFAREKFNKGIFSDLWVPILFQEYVIGYIHAWISTKDRPPFEYTAVDTLYQFAAVLAYSFQINGFFEKGKVKNTSFEGKVIDISVSGMLFAYPNSGLASSLLPDSELAVKFSALKRTVSVNTRIVRRYRDSSHNYYGCCFLDMSPEDMRFLFEFLYGRSYTDSDAIFLSGQV